jgi:ATP-dependent DNA helicase RecQ
MLYTTTTHTHETDEEALLLRDAVVADAASAPLTVLERHFGFREFRPLQEEIVRDALAGRDVLALMPTGGGKSLCYQLPALVRPGLTVVVSPLIALMKDQVDFLRSRRIAAAVLNSTVAPQHMQTVIDQLQRGQIRLLYVAPERLMQQSFLEKLSRWNVAMFAIDEAHCISDWGHDFRPEYRMLRELRMRFPQVPMMALTATATDRVRTDIVTQLGLREPGVYVASFNRPNLTYRIEPKRAPYERLLRFIEGHKGQSGIVYCHTRKQTEGLAARLRDSGYKAAPYHAGLEQPVRARNQDLFLRDEVQIVCATIAFGMGVDKPNIRYVVHYDLPKNIEGYYQETGRAGRDGDAAECLMLFGKADVINHERRADEKETEHERAIARAALDALVQFSESRRCRRRELLAYFGEEYGEEKCGGCDNCLGTSVDLKPGPVRAGALPHEEVRAGAVPQAKASGPPEDRTDDAHRFVACLNEIITASRFSVGVTHVTEVLYGSISARMQKFGHDKLRSYGTGKSISKTEWAHIGKELVRLGYLRQSQNGLPILAITDSGRALLRGGERRVMVAGLAKPAGGGPYDTALFERLKQLRKRLADKQGSPAFVIFTDLALQQMSRVYPTTRHEFMRISGVGEKKLAELGPTFMGEIEEYLRSNAKQEFDGSAPTPRPVKQLGDSEYDTLRRFRAGQPIEQIARERGLKETTVMGHLGSAAEAGESVQIEAFADAGAQSQIGSAFDELGATNLTAVFERLGGRFDYAVLRIYRATKLRRAA